MSDNADLIILFKIIFIFDFFWIPRHDWPFSSLISMIFFDLFIFDRGEKFFGIFGWWIFIVISVSQVINQLVSVWVDFVLILIIFIVHFCILIKIFILLVSGDILLVIVAFQLHKSWVAFSEFFFFQKNYLVQLRLYSQAYFRFQVLVQAAIIISFLSVPCITIIVCAPLDAFIFHFFLHQRLIIIALFSIQA